MKRNQNQTLPELVNVGDKGYVFVPFISKKTYSLSTLNGDMLLILPLLFLLLCVVFLCMLSNSNFYNASELTEQQKAQIKIIEDRSEQLQSLRIEQGKEVIKD